MLGLAGFSLSPLKVPVHVPPLKCGGACGERLRSSILTMIKVTIDDDELIELIKKERPDWPPFLCEALALRVSDYEWERSKKKPSQGGGIVCVESFVNAFQFYPDVWTFARSHFLTMKNARERLKLDEYATWLDLGEPIREHLKSLDKSSEDVWVVGLERDDKDDTPFLIGEPSLETLTIKE